MGITVGRHSRPPIQVQLTHLIGVGRRLAQLAVGIENRGARRARG